MRAFLGRFPRDGTDSRGIESECFEFPEFVAADTDTVIMSFFHCPGHLQGCLCESDRHMPLILLGRRLPVGFCCQRNGNL